MTMKMRFLGGYDNVTGSCILLEDEERGFRCLVDCGLTQGEDADPRWNSGEKIPDSV
jgi:Cft2 family RNA processing exonuclease